jgi:sugar lactone lactonase YvrE
VKANLVLPFSAELGEGMNLFPDGTMRWVDLPNGRGYIWDGAANRDWFSYPFEISKVLPWQSGSIIMGQTAIIFIDDAGVELERIVLHEKSSNLRCSDSLVLPTGELLVGILDRDLTPNKSRLIKVNLDRSIEVIVEVASISNGITLLPDGERVVWTDSPRKELEVFDLRDGKLSARRNFASLPDGIGLADGICADRDGGIWAALWAGGGVAHFDSAGRLDEIIRFDAPNVTSCAFDREDNLIITTGTATLTDEDLARFPGAGGLWQISNSEIGTGGAPIQIAKF